MARVWFDSWHYLRSYWSWGSFEMSFLKTTFWHVKLEIGDDVNDHGNCQFALALPFLFAFWFTVRLPFLGCYFVHRETGKRWPNGKNYDGMSHAEYTLRGPIYGDRWPKEWCFSIHLFTGCSGGPSIDLSLGAPADSGSRGDWRWYFHPAELLFGRVRFSKEVIYADDAEVHLEDPRYDKAGGCYPVTVEVSIDTWEFPRWPFWPLTRRLVRTHVECAEGVPVPGKGENSWDCGMDRTYSISSADLDTSPSLARLVPFPVSVKAVQKFSDSITKTRQERG